MSDPTPQSRSRRLPWYAALLLVSGAAGAAHAAPDSPSARTLGVHPLLVDAASQVWSVVARDDNPVWPGWNATDTPLLLYLPGEQEILIHHPHPPEGFVHAEVPGFPGDDVWKRDGATLIATDGQNTAMDVAGVRTLVVADPLSNLRQRVAGWLEDPRPAAEKARGLRFDELTADPYEQLALIVHESFHVHQQRTAPDREPNEMLLLHYPTLSAENNALVALESDALASAIAATDPGARREGALRWLAIRDERRAHLPERAVRYEDGVEFLEGLAKYTEYRLFEVLEERTPVAGLARAQGFRGFSDLAPQRRDLLAQMGRFLRGEAVVNNDPFGTAPVRFRLYYSGMGAAILLDRLAPDWKRDFLPGSASLTDRVRAALGAGDDDLRPRRAALASDTACVRVLAEKSRLAGRGRAEFAARAAAIERGAGTGLLVDYSRLATPRVALGFTPFGITVLDSVRTIFGQVPIEAEFDDGSLLSEQFALPLLRDTRRREVLLRLESRLPRAELARRLAPAVLGASEPRPLALELPGVTLRAKRATVALDRDVLRVTLHPEAAPAR